MLKIKVGQRIYLTREDASITDTVEGFGVGNDADGNEAVLWVSLKVLGKSVSLAKHYSWSKDVWTVDELDGEAPTYTSPEVEAIGDLIDNFPSVR